MHQKNRFSGMLAVISAISIMWPCGLFGGGPAKIGADDWPQWRGPNRTGVSAETGLLAAWPEQGPRVLWRVQTGEGYSAPSVVQDRLYILWGDNGATLLMCLNAADGSEIWRYKLGGPFSNDQGDGPRGSATVHDGLVYAVTAESDLHAVDAASGKRVWRRDLVSGFNATVPRWGYSGSPLIEGERLFVEIGGSNGRALGAFDRKTGDVLWTSQSGEPGYSSPVAVTLGGARQIVFFSAYGLIAVKPDDGGLLWKYPWSTSYNVNAAIPLLVAPDKILISSGYGNGAALVQVAGTPGSYNVETVWKTSGFKNHFNSSVLYKGFAYGFDNAILKCIDLATGETAWQARGFQKGSLMLADGLLIVLGERGRLALVEATPSEYREKSAVQILDGKCWTMPVLAGGRLYVRNQKELLALQVSGSGK